MPSFNLANKTLRYAASDETLIDKAITLLRAMSDFDSAAKQDAGTGLNALRRLQDHIHKQRNPEPEKSAPALAGK